MKIEVKGTTIECSEFLNEKTEIAFVSCAIDEVLAKAPGEKIRFDFSRVEAANSSGIFNFLKLMKRRKVSAIFVNAPVWLVDQFNCIEEFFVDGSTVESLFAHFYCPAQDVNVVRLLVVGKDFPVLEDYSNFNLKCTDTNGNLLEPDFDPVDYFMFISKRFSDFRSMPVT